jgi:hypothetical protein
MPFALISLLIAKLLSCKTQGAVSDMPDPKVYVDDWILICQAWA